MTRSNKYCKPCGIEFDTWSDSVSHELICPNIIHPEQKGNLSDHSSISELSSTSSFDSQVIIKSKKLELSEDKQSKHGLLKTLQRSYTEDNIASSDELEQWNSSADSSLTGEEVLNLQKAWRVPELPYTPLLKRQKVYFTEN